MDPTVASTKQQASLPKPAVVAGTAAASVEPKKNRPNNNKKNIRHPNNQSNSSGDTFKKRSKKRARSNKRGRKEAPISAAVLHDKQEKKQNKRKNSSTNNGREDGRVSKRPFNKQRRHSKGPIKVATSTSTASATFNDCSSSLSQAKKSTSSNNNNNHNNQKKQPKKKAPRIIKPFAEYVLQARAVPEPPTLWWHGPYPHIPLATERALFPILLPNRARERGMMKDLPSARLHIVQDACTRYNVTLLQALNLRRQLMHKLNRYLGSTQLALGRDADIKKSADLLEVALEASLDENGIGYYSEDDQRQHNRSHQVSPVPPTPDILFQTQVRCVKYSLDDNGNKMIAQVHVVSWMDAKLFYGASSIPQNNKSAVGKLVATARKYTQLYGPGAFLLAYGCGDKLAHELQQVGVLVVDCLADTDSVSLEQVQAHQRTWCANADGTILP